MSCTDTIRVTELHGNTHYCLASASRQTISRSARAVAAVNEYGDFLSDIASGAMGNLGTGASGSNSFAKNDNVDIAMFELAGGAAPYIAGQNVANPVAAMLAFGMLLDHLNRYDLRDCSRLSLPCCIENGDRTRDLGGKLNTDEFTKAVIDNIPTHL